MDFQVFNRVDATVSGRRIPLRPKEQQLLACLLCAPGAPVSVDRLIDELWGQDWSGDRRGALRVHLSHLRRALASPDGGPSRLISTPAGYALSIADNELDATRFHRLLRRGVSAASTSPESALAVLREAERISCGIPFGDLDSPVVGARRAQLEGLRTDLITTLAPLEAGWAARPDIEALVRWQQEQPTSESVAVALARAYARTGDTVSALALLRRFRRDLVEQFGLDPSPMIAGAETEILRRVPAGRGSAGRGAKRPSGPLAPLAPPERADIVDAAVAALRAGRDIALVAPRGLGRTTTVRAIAARIPRAPVLQGVPQPYAVLRQLVHETGGEVDRLLRFARQAGSSPSTAEPIGALVNIARSALAHIDVLVLDDAHLLDQDSAAVLRQALSVDGGPRLAATASDVQHALTLIDRHAGRVAEAHVGRLDPLGPPACAEILVTAGSSLMGTDLERAATELAERSGGHPVVASALARLAPTNAAPESLVAYAAHLRAALPQRHRAILDCAVVDAAAFDAIGVGEAMVDLGLLTALGHDDSPLVVAALEHGLALGLLRRRVGDDGIGVHRGWLWPLVSDLGILERQQVHALLARARSDRGDDPAIIVAHLRSAALVVTRADFATALTDLGAHQLQAGALRAAISTLTEAADVARAGGVPEPSMQALLLLANALLRAGRLKQGLERAYETSRLARAAADVDALAEAAILSAALLQLEGDDGDIAAALCGEALDGLSSQTSLLRVRLRDAQIRALVLRTDLQATAMRGEAEDELRRALEVSGDQGEIGATALNGLRNAALSRFSTARDRLRLSERAVRAAAVDPASPLHLTSLKARASDALLVDPHSSLRHLLAYRDVARSTAHVHHRWLAARCLAARAEGLGLTDEHAAALLEADAESEWLDQEFVGLVEVVSQVGLLWRRSCWVDLADLLAMAVTNSEFADPLTRCASLAVALRTGAPFDESEFVEAVDKLADHSGHVPAYVTLASGGPCTTPRGQALMAKCHEVAERYRGEWVALEGGLSLLGPVSSFKSEDVLAFR